MKRQQIQRKPVPTLSPFEVAIIACQALNQQEQIAIIKWLGLEIGVQLYTEADVKKKREQRSPILTLKDA